MACLCSISIISKDLKESDSMPELESGGSTEVLLEEIQSLKQALASNQTNEKNKLSKIAELDELNKSMSKDVKCLRENLTIEKNQSKKQQETLGAEISCLKKQVKTLTEKLEFMSKKGNFRPFC